MITQGGIKAAVDIEGIVIRKVGPFRHAQSLQFALEDGQVIGYVVADDDSVFGKV